MDQVAKGRNGVFLSYGQTGSGKSFVTLGENNFELEKSVSSDINNPHDSRGIVVRAVRQLLEASKNNASVEVSLSFYDIYLDNIRDIGKYVNDDLNKLRDVNQISADILESEYLEVHERH